MATTEAVLAALADLRGDLDSGDWLPDEYERQMAVVVQAEGGTSPDAVRAGLRAVGPDGTDGRLAPVAANCAALLDGLSPAGPEGKHAVQAALDEVLDLVVLAGLR
jgi:hypothetical protein